MHKVEIHEFPFTPSGIEGYLLALQERADELLRSFSDALGGCGQSPQSRAFRLERVGSHYRYVAMLRVPDDLRRIIGPEGFDDDDGLPSRIIEATTRYALECAERLSADLSEPKYVARASVAARIAKTLQDRKLGLDAKGR